MNSISAAEQSHTPALQEQGAIRRLWSKLATRRKRQLALLLALMVFSSAAETLTIGSLVPFLSILTMPERVFQSNFASPLVFATGAATPGDLLVPITILFIGATVLSGGARLLQQWLTTALSFAVGAELAVDVFRRTLYQPYFVHTGRNSAEVAIGASKAKALVSGVILPVFAIINGALLVLSVSAFLFLLDPSKSVVLFAGFAVIYLFVATTVRRKVYANGIILSREAVASKKLLTESLGGIRDVLLDGTQERYAGLFRTIEARLSRANVVNMFVAGSPRTLIETAAIVLVAVVILPIAKESSGSVLNSIPIFAALALGAQRLLPVLQMAYASWVSLRSSRPMLLDVLALLEQPIPAFSQPDSVRKLPFKREISIHELAFAHDSERERALHSVSFSIKKGERLGIVGSTGSGKSTLLDLLMGLLTPTAGFIDIDGTPLNPQAARSWQTQISHVPQHIFFADATILENIALGHSADAINVDRVKRAAAMAQIDEFIDSLPMGYHTQVGENGVRTSGGQRQRLGIARALYKSPSVLLLDEATSALDDETEQAVMESVYALSAELTIIIVAHRISTLRRCDRIVELGRGRVERIGSYQEVLLAGKKSDVA
ncbi:MAG: ABC transporter ATP-binding protein/permease [Leptospirales bacterium]|nr:ABC transporter ATP-binding protein/permease [Leptospirales bacterium]